MKFQKTPQRILTAALLVCFSVTQFQPLLLAAPENSAPKAAIFPKDPGLVEIPAALGRTEDVFKGKSGKTVIILQDAHAIPDSQRNIQKLIGFFQTEFGVSVVGVEGASSELDPQIFRSFPDKELMSRTFDEYFRTGELTGSAAAAILNDKPGYFQGIEDWELYEKGLRLFAQAESGKAGALERVQALNEALLKEKQQKYTPQLLKVDGILREFHLKGSNVLEVLKALAEIREPEKDTQLAAFLAESRRSEKDEKDVRREAGEIAAAFQRKLKSSPELMAFNEKNQKFQTSQLSPGEFAMFMKDQARAQGISLSISSRLEALAENSRKLRDAEGEKFFNELEAFAKTVKAQFLLTDELKALDRETRRLELLERFAELKLTFADWTELQEFTLEPELAALFKAQNDFYLNAQQRDEVFHRNLSKIMDGRKAGEAIMVAGGFHSSGIRSQFKNAGVSYILVRPRIDFIPEQDFYQEHMNGNVSWKNYFRSENGRVNVYQAFVRAVRDKFMAAGGDAPGKMLKSWRDQIVRDLASLGRVASSGRYTSFIDEAAKPDDKELAENLLKVDEFIDALQKLENQGQLNARNMVSTLRPSNILDAATAGQLAQNDWTASLGRLDVFPGVAVGAAARSELRQDLAPDEITNIKLQKVIGSSFTVRAVGSEESWTISYKGTDGGGFYVEYRKKDGDAALALPLTQKAFTFNGLQIFTNEQTIFLHNVKGINLKIGPVNGEIKKEGAVPAALPVNLKAFSPGKKVFTFDSGSNEFVTVRLRGASTAAFGEVNDNDLLVIYRESGKIMYGYARKEGLAMAPKELADGVPVDIQGFYSVVLEGNKITIVNKRPGIVLYETEGLQEVSTDESPKLAEAAGSNQLSPGQKLRLKLKDLNKLSIVLTSGGQAWAITNVRGNAVYAYASGTGGGTAHNFSQQGPIKNWQGIEVSFDGSEFIIENKSTATLSVRKQGGVENLPLPVEEVKAASLESLDPSSSLKTPVPAGEKAIMYEPFMMASVLVNVIVSGDFAFFIINRIVNDQITEETIGPLDLKKKSNFILGRNPKDVDITIDDQAVSKRHARIEFIPGPGGYQLIVTDLNSMNKVYRTRAGAKSERIPPGERTLFNSQPIEALPEALAKAVADSKAPAVAKPVKAPSIPLKSFLAFQSQLSPVEGVDVPRLEYDMQKKKVLAVVYKMRQTGAIPQGDPRIEQAFDTFDAFEDTNYELLNSLFKPDLTVADWTRLQTLLSEMVRQYLDLYQAASDSLPGSFEFVKEPVKVLDRISKYVADEIAKGKLKPNDVLPKDLVDKITFHNKTLAAEIIAVGPGAAYPQERLDLAGFHDLINIVHQKGVRNLLRLIISYGVQQRVLTVSQQSPEDATPYLASVPYTDARKSPDNSVPLPLQHVALAFAQLERNKDGRTFTADRANIYADDQRAGVRLKLGAHSARVQYSFQPSQEKGRIVVNYQDSYENHAGSANRLKIVKGVLEALGFKVIQNGIRIDAYYDKDSAEDHAMNEMPEKLAGAIQLLALIKDWDLKLDNAGGAAAAEKLQERMIEDGYVGTRWWENTEMLARKIPAAEQDDIGALAKIADADIGEGPYGQRDLDAVGEGLQRQLARGAIKLNAQNEIESVPAYAAAKTESPISVFLKMLEKVSDEDLKNMRTVAAVAKAAANYSDTMIIGDVRGFQVVKMTLKTAGDNVTIYLLKDPDTGDFRIGYAVLGGFYYPAQRYDRLRKKNIGTNLLKPKDLQEILDLHSITSGEGLGNWLDGFGLRAKYPKKTVFQVLEQEPGFLDRAVPPFNMDDLKYGSVRSTISPISVGGTAINQGKAIGRAVFNTDTRKPGDFKGGIFINQTAEVTDGDKMKAAEGVIVLEGGPLAHASVQLREQGVPAFKPNGTQILPGVGLQFKAIQGKLKRKKVTFRDSSLTFMGGDSDGELKVQTLTVEEGDLIFLDATNDMFYVVAKASDTAAAKSADEYRGWKNKKDRSETELRSILANVKNESLFKALLDDLLSSPDILSSEKLQTILSELLSDNSKREAIITFFERRIRTFQGKFVKDFKAYAEEARKPNPDILGALLLISRLSATRDALDQLMKAFETSGLHPFRAEMEKNWTMLVKSGQGLLAVYRRKLIERIEKILAETDTLDLQGKIAGGKIQQGDLLILNSQLSRVSKITESLALADFPEDQLKTNAALANLLKLEEQLRTAREKLSQTIIGKNKVLNKNVLMYLSARQAAGGKTDNTGNMRRALKTLEAVFEDFKFKVRNPDGFAVLTSNYTAWQAKKDAPFDPELKAAIAKEYFVLVGKQKDSLLAFLENDTETAPDFAEYLKVVLNVENDEINNGMVTAWKATFERFLAKEPQAVSPELKARLAVFAAVAVRSSGIKEDSKDAAMAGQKETVLNVSGVDAIAEAVVEVWKSGAEGVLVDEMTNPPASFLAFSTDAVTKEQNIRLTTAFGLAKGLVDAEGPSPDVYLLKKSEGADFNVVSARIGDKSKAVVLNLEREEKADAKGVKKPKGGTKLVGIEELFPGNAAKARQDSLTPEQIQAVARVAEFLAGSAGYPIDIEGAVQGDEIYVYQLRPITTIYDAIAQAHAVLKRSELRSVDEKVFEQIAGDILAEDYLTLEKIANLAAPGDAAAWIEELKSPETRGAALLILDNQFSNAFFASLGGDLPQEEREFFQAVIEILRPLGRAREQARLKAAAEPATFQSSIFKQGIRWVRVNRGQIAEVVRIFAGEMARDGEWQALLGGSPIDVLYYPDSENIQGFYEQGGRRVGTFTVSGLTVEGSVMPAAEIGLPEAEYVIAEDDGLIGIWHFFQHRGFRQKYPDANHPLYSAEVGYDTLQEMVGRRSELRLQLTQAVEGIATALENPAASVNPAQAELVIANYTLQGLKDALKETFRSRTERKTGTAISDVVFAELSSSILGILGTPVDSKAPSLSGTVGFILDEKQAPSNSFINDFMKILGKSSVKTVVISGKGKAADEVSRRVKGEGRTPYPIRNPKQRMVLETDGPVPALVLDPSAKGISETFLRFVIKNENVSDTLAEDFAGFLGAWCAVRSAELLTINPDLLKDRTALRAQLLKDLFNAGLDAGSILMDENGEFQIRTTMARIALQARSEQRVAQSA